MNNQKPARNNDSLKLLVHSIFHTIQGEGPFSGNPAIFIRLAGCNLQCPMCDTDYTSKQTEMSEKDILDQIQVTSNLGLFSNTTPLIVLTGGEPLRQNVAPLIKLLIEQGFAVQIETNGTKELPSELFGFIDRTHTHFPKLGVLYIVVSPKTSKVHFSIEQWAYAYKYVLNHRHIDPDDGLPTNVLGLSLKPCRPPNGALVYIIPEESFIEGCLMPAIFENCNNIKACIKFSMKFGYIMQVQLHKVIGVA